MDTRSRTSVRLNAYRVKLSEAAPRVYYCHYSRELYDSLVNDYKDYWFYRGRHKTDDVIFAWAIRATEEALPEEFDTTTASVQDHPRLVAKILQQSVVSFFRDKGRHVYNPSHRDDRRIHLKNEEYEPTEGLALQGYMEFSVQPIATVKSDKPILALRLFPGYRPEFTIPESELSERGVDVSALDRNREGEIANSPQNISAYLEEDGSEQRFQDAKKSLERRENLEQNVILVGDTLNKCTGLLWLPDGLTVDSIESLVAPSSVLEHDTFGTPRMRFYNERSRRGRTHNYVQQLKPYSHDLFRGETVRLLLVTPGQYEDKMLQYMPRLKSKLVNIFHLNRVEWEVEVVPESLEGYGEVMERNDLSSFDLVLVVVPAQKRHPEPHSSPYFVLKAHLLNRGIVSQDINPDTVVRKWNEYVERNLALNIYAKLGGTAWTLDRERTNRELVMGVGASSYDQEDRVYGFTTIFDYNGSYIAGDYKDVSVDGNYRAELTAHIESVVRYAIEAQGVISGGSLHLTIHLFKEASWDSEVAAVVDAITSFKEIEVSYTLVHLSRAHNYRFYPGDKQDGLSNGILVGLEWNEALVQVRAGANPIYVKIDERSSTIDRSEVLRQVNDFAYLSHRSFLPPSRPVTLLYSSELASRAARLREVGGWDPRMLDEVRDVPWFL